MQAWTFRLPLKKSEKIDFELTVQETFSNGSNSLETFLGVHPKNDENYWTNVSKGLKCLSRRREEAVGNIHRVTDLPSCQTVKESIRQYFAALEFTARRLDFTDKGAKIAFIWYDVFNPLKKAKQRHVALERTCLAFNLAACELVAASVLVSNVLGGNSDVSLLVEACRQYQVAAGHFSVLCTSPPDGSVTLDLGLEALNVFLAAALASAQTCMCEYAQRTGKKDAVIAVLCAGASNTWLQVVQRSRVRLLSGDGTYKQISDCAQYLSVFYEREAEIRMSQVNSERDEKGEQIARLNKALNLSQSLKKLSKSLTQCICFPGILTLKNRADQAAVQLASSLKIAEKENNSIYMQTVPDSPSPIQGRVSVRSANVSDTLSNVNIEEEILSGFHGLVPLHLRNVASNFDAELKSILGHHLHELQQLTFALNDKIFAFEDCLFSDQGRGPISSEVVPEHLQAICYIRDNGGWSRLEEMRFKIEKLNTEVRTILSRCKQILDKEKDRALIAQARVANGWQHSDGNMSPVTRGYKQELTRLEEQLELAVRADNYVSTRMKQTERSIKSLDSFELHRDGERRIISLINEALNQVPQDYIDARNAVIERLETAKNVVARRQRLQKTLEEEFSQESIAMILASSEHSVEETLQSHIEEQKSRIKNVLEGHIEEQKKIILQLEDAYNLLHSMEGDLNKAVSEVQDRIRNATSVCESWKEIKTALEQGMAFYQKALKSAKQLENGIEHLIDNSVSSSQELQHVQKELRKLDVNSNRYSATIYDKRDKSDTMKGPFGYTIGY
ncbi:ALG-2 interacting protein X [Galdieria sulphuraria]|nr:ALG-2 interacting protein X [Galdieria sulphuraria]